MTPDVTTELILKLVGSLAGAALALVFVPPRTRQGFARRLIAALICGTIFANYVRSWAAFDNDGEGLLAASCLTAYASWWCMGTLKRITETWQPKSLQDE